MHCIAHRGFAGGNPENTVVAAEAAVSAGADCIEVDVRRCGSEDLVAVHDERLDRLAGVDEAVGETPLSTLQSYSVLGSNATFPTLDEVFAAVPSDISLHVELKERGLAPDCLAVFDRFDNNVLVSSFDAGTLREMGERGDQALALLFADDMAANLSLAGELGCTAVHPARQCCDRESVAAAHDAGFAVNAWTVRSAAEADRLAALGVDGLVVDAPRFCRDG